MSRCRFWDPGGTTDGVAEEESRAERCACMWLVGLLHDRARVLQSASRFLLCISRLRLRLLVIATRAYPRPGRCLRWHSDRSRSRSRSRLGLALCRLRLHMCGITYERRAHAILFQKTMYKRSPMCIHASRRRRRRRYGQFYVIHLDKLVFGAGVRQRFGDRAEL